MNFEILKGDIATVAADAIVLPANRHLKEGSGASTAIFEAAGRKQLTAACAKIGYCEVGNSVATPAFQLKANYIIHSVVPKWQGGDYNEYDLLSSAYLSALSIADVMGCGQIAFPLLASGNNGFNRKAAFEIAVRNIKSFEARNLKNAYLVLYGNGITSLAKSNGYRVFILPSEPIEQANVEFHNNLQDYKKAGREIVEEQLQKGLDWINDPMNRKKVERAAQIISSAVLAFIFKDPTFLKRD